MYFHFNLIPRTLNFRFEAGTSRGIMRTHQIWWIAMYDPNSPQRVGWGEAAPLPKLSVDHGSDFEDRIRSVLSTLQLIDFPTNREESLKRIQDLIPPQLPSVRFALETALLDWFGGGKKRIFPTDFYDQEKPIPINGLIWMGDRQFMQKQIEEKIEIGFSCIKMKIGAMGFEQELALLRSIRNRYSEQDMVLRVDANGAFSAHEALHKLDALASLRIHSIEQPIPSGLVEDMAHLCERTPLPIALDEELIGVVDKGKLLDQIRPQFIILKPTLLGGISQTRDWIDLAASRNIGWWMTSALESNVGLNAIAQLAACYSPDIPQGLGTGQLYENNLNSPLEIQEGQLWYRPKMNWEVPDYSSSDKR